MIKNSVSNFCLPKCQCDVWMYIFPFMFNGEILNNFDVEIILFVQMISQIQTPQYVSNQLNDQFQEQHKSNS